MPPILHQLLIPHTVSPHFAHWAFQNSYVCHFQPLFLNPLYSPGFTAMYHGWSHDGFKNLSLYLPSNFRIAKHPKILRHTLIFLNRYYFYSKYLWFFVVIFFNCYYFYKKKYFLYYSSNTFLDLDVTPRHCSVQFTLHCLRNVLSRLQIIISFP